MTADQDALAARVRVALRQGRSVHEVAMFGGLSFMVHDRMVVAVGRDGDLLVRIDPARHDELLTRPGAIPAVMGSDRPMGPGWVRVSREGLTTDEQLGSWIHVALDHHASGPEAPPKRKTR